MKVLFVFALMIFSWNAQSEYGETMHAQGSVRDAVLDRVIFLGAQNVIAEPKLAVSEKSIAEYFSAVVDQRGCYISSDDQTWILENAFAALSQYRQFVIRQLAAGEELPRFATPKPFPQSWVCTRG